MVHSAARRRAGPAVHGLAGGVRQGGSTTWGPTISDVAGTRGDPGHNPVDVGSAGGVGVVDNECPSQRHRPGQRRREVGPFAGVQHRYRRTVGERWTRDRQWPAGRRCRDSPTDGRHFRRNWRRSSAATAADVAGHRCHECQARDSQCDSVKCARCRFHTGHSG